MNKIILYLFILSYIILLNAIPVPPSPPPPELLDKVDHHESVSDSNDSKKFYQEPSQIYGNSDGTVANAPNNSNDNSGGVYAGGGNAGGDTTVIVGGSNEDGNDADSINDNSSNSNPNASNETDNESAKTTTKSSSPTSSPTADNNNSNLKKEDNKNENPNKRSYKGYIIFVIVVFVIVILLSVSIFIYKRKYVIKDIPRMPTRESTIGFKTGNLMEKIQAISVNNSMEVQHNEDPLINYSMASAMNTDLNTSSIKNALEPNKGENYNKWFDSMKRGLKPPPSRENNNNSSNHNKMKKTTKITANGSPLSISTSRSKSPDISKSFKSASKDFSVRNSTDISGHTPTLISHCSSNGGVYAYKNNKLNKHTSVAMTFGCVTEREDSYQDLSSPSRSSNNTSSRVSKISTAHTSSQRSLTSFISNSPITQSFKSRFSSYFAGGRRHLSSYDSYRKNNESEGTNNMEENSSKTTSNSKNRSQYISGAEFGNITPKKSLNKIDTSIIHIRNDKDLLLTPTTANTPVENSYEISTSTEQLIEKQDILNSFLDEKDKAKLELSFLNDKNDGKLDLSFSNYGK